MGDLHDALLVVILQGESRMVWNKSQIVYKRSQCVCTTLVEIKIFAFSDGLFYFSFVISIDPSDDQHSLLLLLSLNTTWLALSRSSIKYKFSFVFCVYWISTPTGPFSFHHHCICLSEEYSLINNVMLTGPVIELPRRFTFNYPEESIVPH